MKNSAPIPQKDVQQNEHEISDEDSEEYLLKDEELMEDFANLAIEVSILLFLF